MSDQKHLAVYSVKDIEVMAQKMAPAFNKSPQDLFTLMMIANAEGINPAHAAQEYDIIKGKAALNSRSAQSRFQRDGGKIEWIKSTDSECEAKFSHPNGSDFTARWTIEDARKAGLLGKDNWKGYPADMLRARVLAKGIRACYPACLSGLYTVEEVKDIKEPINRTPPKTEATKAPDFTANVKDAEPEPKKKISDDFEKENVINVSVSGEEFDFSIYDNAQEPETIQSLLDWEVALSEDVASSTIIEWIKTRDLDTQKMAAALLDNAQEQGNIDVGLVRCAFLHPELATIKQKNSDTLTKVYFERTIVEAGDPEEIRSWVSRVAKFITKED